MKQNVRRLGFCAIMLSSVAPPASGELVVAHIAPLTGPIAAADGLTHDLGIRIALDAVNANGGVHGQKVVLKVRDDKFEPERTIDLVRQEANTDTLAMLMAVGSRPMAKMLQDKILDSVRLPVVGMVPGAEFLRKPANPYLYHVRAGDEDQYRHLIEHTTTVGMRRYAIVHVDIPFGKGGQTAIEALLKSRDLKPVAVASFPMVPNHDFGPILKQVKASDADVVLLISPPEPAGEFIRAYRTAGLNPPVLTLSYGLAEILCKVAGAEKAKGVGLVQVFPNGNSPTTSLARRFQVDFKRFAPSGALAVPNHFEAYVTTQVVIEALRRAGPKPTREKVVKALDSMKDVDLGGFVVDFSPGKHTGSRFVDIGIVSNECKLVF